MFVKRLNQLFTTNTIKLVIAVFCSFIFLPAFSQCFQIESILVDGCDGSNEGQNEMVSFTIGSSPLNVSNLSVAWANTSNPWLGICQNASTANDVALINSTITGCGYLKEPVGGVLPANAKVILVTSESFNPLAQSFVNLSDTLYVIFQCSGNTAGHFANYQGSSSLRTLQMTFSGSGGCTESVTYNRNLLIDQNGLPAAQDGARVDFTASGTPSYVNYGCQGPFNIVTVDAGTDVTTCKNTPVSLTAIAVGNYSNITWSGGAGNFSSPNSLITNYTPNANEIGIVKLFCTIIKPCGTSTTTVTDSVVITIEEAPQASILSSNGTNLCPNQTTTLSFTLTNSINAPVTNLMWLPGNATTTTFPVNYSTVVETYTLQIANDCGTNNFSITINPLFTPTLAISANGPTQFCNGSSVTLTATGNGNSYSWSTGVTSPSISVNNASTVTVTSSNICGSSSASETISIVPTPTVLATPSATNLCDGNSGEIIASSNCSNFLWSNGATSNTLSINQSGVYTVSVSNQCGNASTSSTVTTGNSPILSIVATKTLVCEGETTTLQVTGGQAPYTWSSSGSTLSTITSGSGIITASSTNSCGIGTASITVFESPLRANFSYISTSGLIAPSTVIFQDKSYGNPVLFNWSFSNSPIPAITPNAQQTFEASGSYSVWLKVTDATGCVDSTEQLIYINESVSLWVPNSFTPNGDQLNDVFTVKSEGMEELNCLIYNRWGEKVYEWNGVTGFWDGNLSECDVYIYKVIARGVDRKLYETQGHVTLVR